MTEKIQGILPDPHVDMIRQLLDLAYKPNARIREKKGEILSKLGFSKSDIFHELSFLQVGSSLEHRDKLLKTIQNEIANDNNVMVIGYDTSIWNSNLGAHPVATISSEAEMRGRLIQNGNSIEGIKTQRGEILGMDEAQVMLACYKKSREAEMSGLEGNRSTRKIRLGGGFRIQVDGISFEDNELQFKLTGLLSFDDSHQRVLAQASVDDKTTPQFIGSYEIVYSDGILKFPDRNKITIEDAIQTKDIHNYSKLVIEEIIDQDQKAITQLLRLLFSVSPTIGAHQLEGFFSLPGDKIKTTIIDFDGVDNVDTVRSHVGENSLPELSAQEKLTTAKLIKTGFLLSDPFSMRNLFVQKRELEILKKSVLGSEIPEEVKSSVESHLSHQNIFERELTGPVVLGRLLKTLNLDTESTNYPWLKNFRKENNLFYLINASGFDIAYWEKDDELMNTINPHTFTQELSRLTEQEITKAHLNYLKEGD